MKTIKAASLIPRTLEDERPLDILLPPLLGNSRHTWMGHGINPKGSSVNTPIGTLYYMLWCQKFAQNYNAMHTVLIVDNPLKHDGLLSEEIQQRAREKRDSIERIIEAFDLDRLEIIGWEFFIGDKQYQHVLNQTEDFLKNHPELRTKLAETCVPLQYRSNPRSYLYVLDEIAAVMFMTQVGSVIRIGHLHERRLDKIIKIILEHRDFPISTEEKPATIYLKGDYELSYTNKYAVVPPTKERDSARRVMLTDSPAALASKVECSTKEYRGWLKSILRLAGKDTVNLQASSLASTVHKILLEPVQNCRGSNNHPYEFQAG